MSEDPQPLVCVTHLRFIPCRSDGPHRYSSDPTEVASVYAYHHGDDL